MLGTRHNGFPALTQNLAWTADDDFYVIGALAALQLGPDALNLAGARHGACRLGHQLREACGHGQDGAKSS